MNSTYTERLKKLEERRKEILSLPEAPRALVKLIEDTMEEFGPDGHVDGSEEISRLVLQWFKAENYSVSSEYGDKARADK